MTKAIGEIAKRLIDFWIVARIFHWQTEQYSVHKATDGLLSELEEKTDEMLEIIQGATGTRIRFEDGIRSDEAYRNITKAKFIRKARSIAKYLMTMERLLQGVVAPIEGVLNVRDELIASIQQTLYLLSFR